MRRSYIQWHCYPSFSISLLELYGLQQSSVTVSQHHLLVFSSQGIPARWRDFHSATIIGTKMFVFGGRADRFGPFHSNNEIYCNKIRVFDTETNCWLSTPSTQPLPEGRRSHSACKTQTQKITMMNNFVINSWKKFFSFWSEVSKKQFSHIAFRNGHSNCCQA